MNNEQFKRAQEITSEIADLIGHKKQVSERSNPKNKPFLMLDVHGLNIARADLRESFFIIPLVNWIPLYMYNVDKKITELENEFNNL